MTDDLLPTGPRGHHPTVLSARSGAWAYCSCGWKTAEGKRYSVGQASHAWALHIAEAARD